ncbi:LamG-like jellyroll fold domain-containing protein [Fibrobacter sp. UWB12]|uniref:LamG-like jellyroll fold domain-containing protein n=1 Tax=Fibrobacter sp. UWB12 TaxID=1896203 RepID=UPI00091408CF|nr:LamG-like jellyroll fold domain-containing protein [Fibrobacter sp. UWB12]SHK88446.1 Concanavalin A-like lectin/glucanases superfamily protein [Fibrobacter sp. UWB12]
MKNRQVYLKLSRNCAACVMSLAFSLTFLACSDSDDVAGGVTDIGNSIADLSDTLRYSGVVQDLQGRAVPAARVVAYLDNSKEIVDSLETVADSTGFFKLGPIPRISAKGSPRFYAESKGLSGLRGDGLSDVRLDTICIAAHKTLSGKISGATSGYMRIQGTHLRSLISEDGSFAFDSIPAGYRMDLVYVQNDSAIAQFEFTALDSKDSLKLPELSVNGEWLTSNDMPVIADYYSFHYYLPYDYPENLPNGYGDPEIEVYLGMNRDINVLNHDSSVAENVNYVDGLSGKAVLLEPGQFIDLDTLNPTGGDFTLSLWTKWNGPNGEHQVLFSQREYWSDSTSRFQWHYEVNSGTFAVMKGMPDYPGAVYFGDSTSVPVGEWAFLVLVSKNHKVSMYVNGKAVAIAGSDGAEFAREFVPNDLKRSVPFRIGGDEIETETWNGVIDEVRVESIARSPEWINAMYERLKP